MRAHTQCANVNRRRKVVKLEMRFVRVAKSPSVSRHSNQRGSYAALVQLVTDLGYLDDMIGIDLLRFLIEKEKQI